MTLLINTEQKVNQNRSRMKQKNKRKLGQCKANEWASRAWSLYDDRVDVRAYFEEEEGKCKLATLAHMPYCICFFIRRCKHTRWLHESKNAAIQWCLIMVTHRYFNKTATKPSHFWRGFFMLVIHVMHRGEVKKSKKIIIKNTFPEKIS